MLDGWGVREVAMALGAFAVSLAFTSAIMVALLLRLKPRPPGGAAGFAAANHTDRMAAQDR